MAGVIAAETDALDQAKPIRRFRSNDELGMRDAVDVWGRARWPAARVVHELVMARGSVRADMAFIEPDHLVSIEIKSVWDYTDRLINQACMFRLATPETWIVVDQKHLRDADLVHYLLPSIGVAVARRDGEKGPFQIEVHRPHATFYLPNQEAMLSLLWVAELRAEAGLRGLSPTQKMGHAALVKLLLRLPAEERMEAVCRQLRARDALWRADPPVHFHD